MLLELWEANKADIESKHIQQLVAIAGDGKLRDNSACSKEVRAYLSQVDIDILNKYVKQCLDKSFSDSGLALQDLVNELGRRLDFTVEDGLYQGRSNQVGFDGLWFAPEGFSIIAEVKTTDAYRISLDTLAKYRSQLIKSGTISDDSSVLIIVGRQDTGDLEAQVRGSKHAWDIRIISADSLMSLAKVKVSSEEDTSEKMRLLLRPVEYTRLDSLVDIVYTTAQDIEETAESEPAESVTPQEPTEKKSTWEFTDSKLLDAQRKHIIEQFALSKGKSLIKKTRATYWSPDRELRTVCTISKRYEREGQRYWYAYHPKWDDFLKGADDTFVILGCMDLDIAFAIPRNILVENLPNFNVTEKPEGKSYWHLAIAETEQNKYQLVLPKIGSYLDIMEYKLEIQNIL